MGEPESSEFIPEGVRDAVRKKYRAVAAEPAGHFS